jgi:hypothetical protein
LSETKRGRRKVWETVSGRERKEKRAEHESNWKLMREEEKEIKDVRDTRGHNEEEEDKEGLRKK